MEAEGRAAGRDPSGLKAGCLAAFFSVFVGCVMLVLNGGIVASIYVALRPLQPDLLGRPQFSQLVFFLGPVVLLVIEWMLMDALTDRLRRRS